MAGAAGIPGTAVTPENVQRAAQMAQAAAPQLQRAVQVAAPHAQRVARTAVQTAAQVTADFDTKDVPGSLGRSSGRLYAKLRRSMKEASAASGQR
jgi:hypothetical protein